MREKKGTEDREERENGDSFLDEDQIAVVFLDGLEHVDGERREVLHRIYPSIRPPIRTVPQQYNDELVAHRHHLDPLHLPCSFFQHEQRVVVAEILQALRAYPSAERPVRL